MPRSKSAPRGSDPKTRPADLQIEVDALRSTIDWLKEAFARAESLEDRLKISANLGLNISHLAKLVRTQDLMRVGKPSDVEKALETVLKELEEEWDLQRSQ